VIGRLLHRLNVGTWNVLMLLLGLSFLSGASRRSRPHTQAQAMSAQGRGARRRGLGWRARWAVVLAAATAAVALVGAAWAFFGGSAAPGAAAEAIAASLPKGHTPTLSLNATDVTVHWAQNSISALGGDLGAADHGGYLVTRYAVSAPTTPISAGSACDGLQQGAADPFSCTEHSVPTGEWTYTVTPKYYDWLGPESDQSAQVNVPPAAPSSVSLTNGVGVGGNYINGTNTGSLNVDVALPSTSLASDTVTLIVTDGTNPITTTKPGTNGSGTLHFTGINGSALNDGTITIKAKSSSSYGDASAFTSTTVTKDTVAPVVNVTASRSPDSNGWYNHPVTFSASTSTDTGGSGIHSCDSDVSYSGPDTSSGSETFHCSDKAGNTASNSISFKYDSTAPTSSASGNDTNWHHSAVTVHLSATDAGAGESGVDHIVYTVDGGTAQTISGNAGDVTIPAPVDHSNDGQHTISFHAVDVAGNVETPNNSVTVKIDTTNPATVSTGADNNWHNSDVTVHLASSDPGYPSTGSGVANLHYQLDSNAAVDVGGSSGVASTDVTVHAPSDHSNDGSHTLTYKATDAAGNVESQGSTTVKIDTTPPAITPNVTGTLGNNGWYTSNVSVGWTTTDTGGSGIASTSGCTSSSVTSDTNSSGTTFTCQATDNAGNTASQSVTIKRDATAPSPASLGTITGSSSPAACQYINGSAVWYSSTTNNGNACGGSTSGNFTVPASASDPSPGSGMAQVNYPSISGMTGGGAVTGSGPSFTTTYHWTASGSPASGSGISAVDNAGNSSGITFTATLDNTAPNTGTITSPSAGNINGTVNLQSTNAADAGSGVGKVAYYRCTGNATTCSGNPPSGTGGWTLISTATSGPSWTQSWDTTSVANNTYTLKAIITDNVGNQLVTPSVVVTINNPNKLVITSSAVSGAAMLGGSTNPGGPNLGPITVTLEDPQGNPIHPASTLTVNLSSSSGNGKFGSSQFPSSDITSVTIPTSGSTATFWYGDTSTGTPTITASATATTSGTQQETITTAPAGLGIVITGGSGSPSASCGTISTSYTCSITGDGSGGNVVFKVTFVDSSGNQVVYSATQSSTITETGQNTGSTTIAANASISSGTLTASHTGSATKTSTLTFGPYTLTISVSS